MKLSRVLDAAVQGKRLLIFDFDGTLADTSALHAQAFEQTLNPRGIAVNYGDIAGRRTEDAILICYCSAGVAPPDRGTLDLLIAEKQMRVRTLIESELQPLPGVEKFLRWMKTSFELALVTSGSRGTVEPALDKLRLKEFFRLVVFGDDVLQAKPSPEGFLRVLESLKVRGDEALIFEDSEVGFAAARAAGIEVLDVREIQWDVPFWRGL